MFKPSPFKDAEKNPEPPERELIDYLGMTCAFIWFYRKIWIGVILMGGLAYLIYYLTVQEQNREIGESKPGPPKTQQPLVPQTEIGAVAKINTPAPASEPAEEAPAQTEKNKVAELLKNGSVSELIEESLDIRDNWGNQPAAIAFMLLRDRLQISKRLMEMEVTESQRTFANVSYVESLSILDSLNVKHQLSSTGIEDAIKELDNGFTQHPDPTIASKSQLAVVLSPANRYFNSGDLNYLREFETELKARLPGIATHPTSLERLCQIMISMKNKIGFEEETTQSAFTLLEQLQTIDDPKIIPTVKRYKEKLLFEHLEIESFVSRIEIDDNQSRAQVQELFTSLAANPDSSSRIFQVAVDSIKAYQAMKKYDDAAALFNWLKQISETIPNETNKNVMRDAMAKIEKNVLSVR